MRHAIAPKINQNRNAGLDYQLCTIPGCRLEFRGPMPYFDAPFVAVLGGNETFGKFVASPFPALLSDWVGVPVANLGVAQAGMSLFSEEQVLLDVASKAEVTVLQVLSAQNMSNRLYSVHARRNDRFLSVSPALRELYPTVDFAEIHFTGHLLSTLKSTSEDAFAVVVEELKWAWTQRMRRILSLIEGNVILLWLSDHTPAETTHALEEEDPRFVDRAMIDELNGEFAAFVEVMIPRDGSLDGKTYPPEEEEAARLLPGPVSHQRIADALAPALAEFGLGPGREKNAARTPDQSFSIKSGTAVNRSATSP